MTHAEYLLQQQNALSGAQRQQAILRQQQITNTTQSRVNQLMGGPAQNNRFYGTSDDDLDSEG